MITNPIIPIPLMIVISIILLIITILTSKRIKLINRILIIIIIFIINLRPMIPNGEVEVSHNNIDMFFVIDTTLSMNAMDYNGVQKRITGVTQDIEYIMDKIPGAHYSIISFDNKATIKIPATSDTNAILSSIKTLRMADQLYAKGSTITIFKETLETVLKRSTEKENRLRIVFIFTDGEQTSENKMDSLKSLEEYIDGGAVLGYGTTKGGKMMVETYSGSGKYEYVQDRTSYPYKDAVSKLDEENLNKMAKEMNIDYIHMTKKSNIDSKLKEINKIKTKSDSEKEESYQDIYFYFSPLLIILFIIELSIDRGKEL